MKKLLAAVVAMLLLIGVLPLSAIAATVDLELNGANSSCDYYNVIQKTDYDLVPGAVESEIIMNNDGGTRRQVVHVIEVDTKNPNVSVMPSFKNISTDVDYTDESNWGSITVTDHASHAEKDLGKNVIGGMNVSLSWDFTHPYGLLMYEGVVLHDSRVHCVDCNGELAEGAAAKGHPGGGYLVIKKDGTAELRDPLAPVEEDDWMAQTVCFSYLVRDGVNKAATEDHTSAGAPRSVLGIKADGTLVIMMVDGRMLPYSEGFSNHEMAEMMIALGCVDAINCDGGGSSTFMTEREGTGELSVKSRFSDGAERQTLTAILVLSNIAATGEFDHAVIETQDKLVTPGSSVDFSAVGADASGGPADLPENVTWQMADDSMGTVENGTFVSSGKTGTATVQMVYNNAVVGEGSVDVVIPDSLAFVQSNITAPYSKSVTLDLVAKYGYSEVKLKNSDIAFSLSNDAIGTISGNTLTATSDTAVTEPSTVTAVLQHNTAVAAEATITLGRASAIVYDFEEGAQSIANWSLSYKNPYLPENYYFNDEIAVVSAEDGGKVKNGKYSLRITSDGDSITCMNWCQTRIDGMDIDLTDAVSISFWMYIPEGCHGLEWDFGNAIPVNLGHEFMYGTGWQHFTVNVADIGTNVTNLNQIRLYHSDTSCAGTNYNHEEHPNYYADVVFYIDDITVNYSSAVDDNQPPVISNALISYEGVDTAVAMTGQTIAANTVAFTAKATDNYSGLDTNSAAVYVDGNLIDTVCSDTGMISTDDVQLPNGGHVVRFEICDKNGNASSFFEYYFTLNGNSQENTIHYVVADPTLDDVAVDSLVWMNLEATEIADVQQVEAVIDLDQNSKWELDHMVLAEGFEATYTIDTENNDAAITLTRTATSGTTGNAVLASIPVRVWSPAFGQSGNEDAHAYRLIAVMSHVQEGLLTKTDNSAVYFGSEEHTVMTEFNNTRLKASSNIPSWHAHTETALDDQDAGCTTEGYTGRTFCESCNSVLEWGNAVAATGHSYDFVDGVLMCTGSCGSLFTGVYTDGKEYVDGVPAADGWNGNSFYRDGVKLTGVQKVPAPDATGDFYYNFGENGVCANRTKYTGLLKDGDLYRYSYLGTLTSGWHMIENEWYYFSPSTMAAVSGKTTVNGIAYEFYENGKLVSGVWVTSEKGTRYMYGPSFYIATGSGSIIWKTIDGGIYGFDNSGYRYEGRHLVQESTNTPMLYDFYPEEGTAVPVSGPWEGHFYTAGIKQYAYQLVQHEGYYYFISDNHRLAVSCKIYLSERFVESKTFADGTAIPVGYYEFDADGKMVLSDGPMNGYFYKNGVKQSRYQLVEWGDDFYFINDGDKLATSVKLYLGDNFVSGHTFPDGTSVAPGLYEFDADGKMIVKNGPVDGYFYKYGVKQSRYQLVDWEDDFYFINDADKLAANVKLYLGDNFVSGHTFPDGTSVAPGLYEFDADGRMIVKNGPVDGYFYKYGIKQKAYQLVDWDDDFYFINDSHKLAAGVKLYLGDSFVSGKTFPDGTPVVPGLYEFDADGKMIVKNGPLDGYFYKYGIKQKAYQLVEWEGDFYFINDSHKLATNVMLYLSETYVAGKTFADGTAIPVGNYYFNADGKMIY